MIFKIGSQYRSKNRRFYWSLLGVSIFSHFVLQACRKSSDVNPRLICNWPDGYTVESKFTNQLASVIRLDSSATYRIFLNDHYYLACNLPEEAKVDSLRVVISGYEMKYPLDPLGMPIGFPLELTKLEILE